MSDWGQLVRETLAELGATETMVPGSKLRVALNAKDRTLADAALAAVFPQSFANAVSNIDGVSVVRRPGTDVLIGLDGSRPPHVARTSKLRDDVFAAFTRISEKPYVYLRDQDRFTSDYETATDGVPVPSLNLPKLMDERRRFAEQLDDDAAKIQIATAIDSSMNPLFAFQRKVTELGLGGAWHRYHLAILVDAIESWAKDNTLTPAPVWFADVAPAVHLASLVTPQDVLSRLARFMTNEEIRSLAIPFTAVEAMYSELAGRLTTSEQTASVDSRGDA